MPQLGESVTEGTISRWLVGPGDTVQKYEPIAEVLTDKVSAEIPSSYTGTIEQLLVDENETVAVGVDICTIVEEASSEAEESNKEIKTEQKPNPPAKEQTKAEPSQKAVIRQLLSDWPKNMGSTLRPFLEAAEADALQGKTLKLISLATIHRSRNNRQRRQSNRNPFAAHLLKQ